MAAHDWNRLMGGLRCMECLMVHTLTACCARYAKTNEQVAEVWVGKLENAIHFWEEGKPLVMLQECDRSHVVSDVCSARLWARLGWRADDQGQSAESQVPCCSGCCYLSVVPSTSHSHSHSLTITCTCCYDEIKGTQDLKIYSHADSQILSLSSCAAVVAGTWYLLTCNMEKTIWAVHSQVLTRFASNILAHQYPTLFCGFDTHINAHQCTIIFRLDVLHLICAVLLLSVFIRLLIDSVA